MGNSTKISFINQQLTSTPNVVYIPPHPIRMVWCIVCADSDSVFELRALWPKGVPNSKPAIVRHYRAQNFPSLEACKSEFENDALNLNAAGYNIYTLLNPLETTFSRRGAAKDEDIKCRETLLIDIDRVDKTVAPATDAEVERAKSLAMQIHAYLTDRGWPDPLLMMSGNGYHLYYILECLPNTTESNDTVKDALNELASKFDNNTVSVDTNVYNASRITKVPGTIMRKGLESAGRPYRMAEVCDDL